MDSLMQKLKQIREDRQISYHVLERATGIRALKLQEAERGEVQLSIGEIDRLLNYYQMTAKQALRYRKLKLSKLILPGVALLVLITIVSMIWLGADPEPSDRTAEPPPAQSIGDSVSGEHTAGETEGDSESDSESDSDLATDEASEIESEVNSEMDQAANNEVDEASLGDEIEEETRELDIESDDTEDSLAGDVDDDTMTDGEDPAGDKLADDQQDVQTPSTRPSGNTVFRFWGNVDYTATELPSLEGNDQSNMIHVVPVTSLTDKRPAWLTDDTAGRIVLNVGNADIWTNSTIRAWEALREDGIPVIGLGRYPDVYDPHIVEVGEQKIGILSLAGLIHEAHQIAWPSRVGLPRAYDNDEVRQAVQQAKDQVDYLFVVIHWGNLHGGEKPIAKQLRLAQVIEEAGGDFIIGNRSLLSQEISVINETPVFYSLGRTISDRSLDGFRRLVLDVHIGDGVEQLVAHVGTVQNGTLRFEPESSAVADFSPKFEVLKQIIDQVEVR